MKEQLERAHFPPQPLTESLSRDAPLPRDSARSTIFPPPDSSGGGFDGGIGSERGWVREKAEVRDKLKMCSETSFHRLLTYRESLI